MERAIEGRSRSAPHAIAKAMADMKRVAIPCSYLCKHRAQFVGRKGAVFSALRRGTTRTLTPIERRGAPACPRPHDSMVGVSAGRQRSAA